MTQVTLTDLADNSAPADESDGWGPDGVVVFRGLIPNEVVDAYCARFENDAADRAFGKDHGVWRQERATGYGIGTPYLRIPELRDVALHSGLTEAITALRDETMGLHLNLTGWRSTQRAWHQDAYLNPPYVGDHYVAAWIALDDIHPDAGPFEYVPGSHRWPMITQARMLKALNESGTDPDWPWRSEAILGPLFDAEIAARGAEVRQFIASKGDVLLWSPRLCHRGSTPKNPDLDRRTLIAHYSSLSWRRDMAGTERRWTHGTTDGWFFALGRVT